MNDPEFELILVPLGRTFFSVNVEESSIQLDYVDFGSLSMGAGEVYMLSDLDWVGEDGRIVGFELVLSGRIEGFDETDISFTDNSVTMVLNGSLWFPGDNTFARIDLFVSHPTPGTLALFGVVGLLGRGRKRRA